MTDPSDTTDEHTTDAADVGVRGEGAHAPIVDDAANLDRGDVGSDVDPDGLGGGRDRDRGEREQLIDEVRDDD